MLAVLPNLEAGKTFAGFASYFGSSKKVVLAVLPIWKQQEADLSLLPKSGWALALGP